MEHAKSTKAGAKFDSGEAAGLARFAQVFRSRHPEFNVFGTSAGHPQTTAFRKINEAINSRKEASLTSEEVDYFLKLYQHIPRPKPI
jgi:hypothetical protein